MLYQSRLIWTEIFTFVVQIFTKIAWFHQTFKSATLKCGSRIYRWHFSSVQLALEPLVERVSHSTQNSSQHSTQHTAQNTQHTSHNTAHSTQHITQSTKHKAQHKAQHIRAHYSWAHSIQFSCPQRRKATKLEKQTYISSYWWNSSLLVHFKCL